MEYPLYAERFCAVFFYILSRAQGRIKKEEKGIALPSIEEPFVSSGKLSVHRVVTELSTTSADEECDLATYSSPLNQIKYFTLTKK